MLAEQRARLDKQAALMEAIETAPPPPAAADADAAKAGLGPVAEPSAGEASLRHGAGFADGLASIPEEGAASMHRPTGEALGAPDANDGAVEPTAADQAAAAGPNSLLRLLREPGSREMGGGVALQLPEPPPRELLVLLSDLFDAFVLIASRQGDPPRATSPDLNLAFTTTLALTPSLPPPSRLRLPPLPPPTPPTPTHAALIFTFTLNRRRHAAAARHRASRAIPPHRGRQRAGRRSRPCGGGLRAAVPQRGGVEQIGRARGAAARELPRVGARCAARHG